MMGAESKDIDIKQEKRVDSLKICCDFQDALLQYAWSRIFACLNLIFSIENVN
jgi:hypothetical protein